MSGSDIPEREAIFLRVSPGLKHRLEVIARRRHRSLNAYLADELRRLAREQWRRTDNRAASTRTETEEEPDDSQAAAGA